MSELEIYNSQGERFDTDQPTVSTRIENFFFSGVRLYIETGREVELTAFFRARESEASRAEQYYAVYRTDSTQRLFEEFTAALRAKIENEHGMLLQTTSEDVQVYAQLNTEHPPPGSASERDDISQHLLRRRQLKFGVGTHTDAIGLIQDNLGGAAKSFGITEDADATELNDCDLLIELGSYTGLTPLGETKEMLGKKQHRQTSSSHSKSAPTGSTEQSEPDKAKRIRRAVVVFVVVFVVILLLMIAAINGAVYAELIESGTFGPIEFV